MVGHLHAPIGHGIVAGRRQFHKIPVILLLKRSNRLGQFFSVSIINREMPPERYRRTINILPGHSCGQSFTVSHLHSFSSFIHCYQNHVSGINDGFHPPVQS